MALIRLENNTPNVYTDESRDFQLLCRLYDCVLNGVKFDIDSMSYINDADYCNSRLIRLLQTKVGFFSNYDINNETRRYIVKTFARIIKSKGTINAIKEAVRMFLLAIKKQSAVEVIITDAKGTSHETLVGDETVYLPYAIYISTEVVLSDTFILDEILSYIIPTGYVVIYNPSTTMNANTDINQSGNLTVLEVSNQIGSQLKGTHQPYIVEDLNNSKAFSRNALVQRLVGTINSTKILSSDDKFVSSDGKLDVANILQKLEVTD